MDVQVLRMTALATLILAGGAVLAFAQDDADSAERPDERRVSDIAPMQAHFRDHGASRDRGRRGGLLGAFGPAGAQDLFDAIDGDGDGALTQAEIDSYLQTQLAGADGDGDGALSLDEFAPVFFERIRPRMVDAFQALDEDGSGEITGDELDGRFGRIVSRLDRNGDDALTLQDGRDRRDGDE